jgi:8-oxo-dGTP pyrophosphatase MutT (NUDIX family)
VTDPIFDQAYNPILLKTLAEQFGPFPHQHVELAASTWVLTEMLDKMVRKRRRGEVVMVVPNDDGQIWLHTKSFYPAGVFRLMTGGVEAGEMPHKAMRREVEEETGFKTKIDRCLAVVTYDFTYNGATLPFVSYVFLTKPVSGFPQPIDPNEKITGFKAIPVAGLPAIARQLRSLEDIFADWGVFRAIAHDLAWQELQAG